MPEYISNNTMITLTVTAVLLFLLPVIAMLAWKKKMGKRVSWKPLFIGAIGFVVSARVLEVGVHMVCIVGDTPVSRFINGNTAAFVLYGIFMAGIFEECGRYIIIKYLMKKNKTAENMIMYGIGHGGIEVWTISLVSILSSLFMANMLNRLGAEKFMVATGVTEQTKASAVATMNQIASFGAGNAAIQVIERILCMVIHISLTLIVFYGIRESKKGYLPLAVLAHAALDLFPALNQRGVVPVWMVEMWLALCCVMLVMLCKKLYTKN